MDKNKGLTNNLKIFIVSEALPLNNLIYPSLITVIVPTQIGRNAFSNNALS